MIRSVPRLANNSAAWHELALHGFAQPPLPFLLSASRHMSPVTALPKLGWVVVDPDVGRQIHEDTEHFSILQQGASGHWWAQMLGDWVYELFAGHAHDALRSVVLELLTKDRRETLLARAGRAMLDDLCNDLALGRTVDLSGFTQQYTTRTMVELVGLPIASADTAEHEAVFRSAVSMADLAKGTWATTTVKPSDVQRGRSIAARIGRTVPSAFASAPESTLIGKCRTLKLGVEATAGLTVLFIVAGTVTLASTMGRLAALLHDTGCQHRLLADRSQIPIAVREGLRVTSSMPIVGRAVTRDVELGGKKMKKGDRVKILTWTMSNSFGAFSLDRVSHEVIRPIWFGGGPYFCLGATLTHGELQHYLEALTGLGRPWTVKKRRYAINTFIPMYRCLDIALTDQTHSR